MINSSDEKSPLIVRLATQDDALDILRWRNDALAREMSRNSDIIEVAHHQTWFNQALKDTDRLVLIGSFGNNKIGMVRFDKLSPNQWEINIVLAPEARGQGFGKQLTNMALQHFISKYPDVLLLAEIKKRNVASLKLFESVGFVNSSNIDDVTMQYIFRPKS